LDGEVGRVSARRRTSARAATLPRGTAPELRRFAPSARSLVVGIALFAVAVGAYLVARDTSLFAIRTIEVRGGTPALQAQVRRALVGEQGLSLLRVDGGALDNRLGAIAGVHSFTYDRAFPHTLRIVVRPEHGVLVLRQSNRAYLVSSTGRVLRALPDARRSALPRLWAPASVQVTVGAELPPEQAAAAIALGPLRGAPLPGGVATVVATGNDLTLKLGGGLELRLGDGGDLRLKLAIARKILAQTGAARDGSGYLDVSVPQRPVLDTPTTESQVEG
jgi:cell division protein FtsQ